MNTLRFKVKFNLSFYRFEIKLKVSFFQKEPKTTRKPSNTKSVQSRLEKEKSVEIDLSNSKFPWSNQPEDGKLLLLTDNHVI